MGMNIKKEPKKELNLTNTNTKTKKDPKMGTNMKKEPKKEPNLTNTKKNSPIESSNRTRKGKNNTLVTINLN